MTPPEWMALTREEWIESARTGKIGPYEKQYIRKDGTRWWGLFTGTRLADDFGVEYVLDISDTREAEEAITRKARNVSGNVAENVPQVIWTNDAEEQRSNYFNARWYEYIGQSSSKNHARPERQRSIVHPDDRAGRSWRWQQALAEGEVFEANIDRLRGAMVNIAGSSAGTFRLRDDGQSRALVRHGHGINDDKERSERVARKRRAIPAPHRGRAGLRDVPDGSGQSRSSTGAKARSGFSAGPQTKPSAKAAS